MQVTGGKSENGASEELRSPMKLEHREWEWGGRKMGSIFFEDGEGFPIDSEIVPSHRRGKKET